MFLFCPPLRTYIACAHVLHPVVMVPEFSIPTLQCKPWAQLWAGEWLFQAQDTPVVEESCLCMPKMDIYRTTWLARSAVFSYTSMAVVFVIHVVCLTVFSLLLWGYFRPLRVPGMLLHSRVLHYFRVRPPLASAHVQVLSETEAWFAHAQCGGAPGGLHRHCLAALHSAGARWGRQ